VLQISINHEEEFSYRSILVFAECVTNHVYFMNIYDKSNVSNCCRCVLSLIERRGLQQHTDPWWRGNNILCND